MAKQVDFDAMQKRFDRLKTTLPRLLARDMLNHSKASFRNQGFTDAALSPWAKRKRPNKADTRTKRSRAILIDSGNLRKSVRIRHAGFRVIRVGSYGLPYASRHNQGLNGMPQRKFVGHSKKLTEKMGKTTMRELKKVFRP